MSKLVEEWRPVVGYEGFYEVSDWGNLRSIDRIIIFSNGRKHPYKGIEPKQRTDVGGYKVVTLSINQKMKIFKVHVLVWEAFNGKKPNGMQVNHKDEDKTNNRLENLELVTPKENCNYGKRNEKISKYLLKKHPRSVKIAKYSLNGTLIKIYNSSRQAAKDNNGCWNSEILKHCKTQKPYKNFFWKYF